LHDVIFQINSEHNKAVWLWMERASG